MQLRSFSLREWLLPFFGLLTPWLYAAVGFWWSGRLPAFQLFTRQDFSQIGTSFASINTWDYPFALFTIAIFALGLLRFAADMNVSTVHRKNSKAVFIWLTVLLASASLYATGVGRDHEGLIGFIACPVGVFGAIFFSGNKRRALIKTIFYLWVLAAVVQMLFSGVL